MGSQTKLEIQVVVNRSEALRKSLSNVKVVQSYSIICLGLEMLVAMQCDNTE